MRASFDLRTVCLCIFGAAPAALWARLFIAAVAAITQLGERQTEDLKVPGSIPGLGTRNLV